MVPGLIRYSDVRSVLAAATCEGALERRTPGSLMPQSPHFGAVPFFLMWRYRRWPPGVRITRTLFERVLYLVIAL